MSNEEDVVVLSKQQRVVTMDAGVHGNCETEVRSPELSRRDFPCLSPG